MAQIIKHRRGSIGALKDVTANVGELVMATGSIGDLNAPVLFIGESAIAGGYKPVSKIFQGASAPTLGASYGSTMDGTPFYSNNSKTLYILDRISNIDMDLTGNIEGNTISAVTINNITGTTAYIANMSGSFTGSGEGLYNIPATGITGLNLSKIYSGSVQVTTDSVTGDIHIDADSGVYISGSTLDIKADTTLTGSLFATKIEGTGSLYLQPNQDDPRLFEIYNTTGITGNDIHIKGNTDYNYFGGDINYLKLDDATGNTTLVGYNGVTINSNVGNVSISSYDGSTLELNTDGGEGHINIGNYSNSIYGYTNTTNFAATSYAQLEASSSFVWVENLGAYLHNDSGSAGVGFTARPNGIIEATGSFNINGNTSITGALVVADGSATFDQGLVAQNSNMLLTSGSSLIVQNSGYVKTDYIEGNTDQYNYLSLNGNGVYGQPGVELSSTGDISLWAEGGTVNVTGSMRVTGDIIFSGSINLGDYSGDTVNFTGEVNSNILPITGNTYSLGSSGQTWSDVWATNAHFSNISLDTIAFSGLTEGRVILGGPAGSLIDSGSLNFNNNELGISGSIKLGENSYIYNDGALFVENNTNGVTIQSNNYAELQSSNAWIWVEGTGAHVEGGSYTKISTDSGNVDLESYDGGIIRLNSDSNGNVISYGHTYINNHNLYVNTIWDNSDTSNYLQLYGYGTDDGFWWESGTGWDTTLLNNMNNANINVIKYDAGDINIDARNGSVNLHTTDGFNVTGSLVVSDASGVFNSSLLVNNSSLTLDGGSHIHMNDAAHLYFDTCVDMYYNSSDGNFIFYNDCNNFQFRNNVSITGSLNVSSGINTDNIYGVYNSFNALHLHNGTYGAPDVELTSYGDISIFSEGNNGRPSTINMTGSVHITNDLDITGSVAILTNLNVSGSASVTGAFTVGSGSITSLGGNLYVSGNLEVLGSSTNVNLESHTVNIGDNIILVNAYSPFQRYAGLAAYDSGSSGVSGSLLWDSQNDYWLFVSASGQSSKIIGTTTGTYGSETNLTSGTFPIADGNNTIGDSLLTYSGTTLAYNVNKFTIDSVSGNTYISGNVTIDTGGTDNGAGSSWVTFRNDDNILGFIDSTDTQDVTTQLLGYDEVDGTLKFSSLIDGGLY
jgi:hypothetical protein